MTNSIIDLRVFQGDVYMYYGLTNYYQNHRRYVKSRDDEQLLGRLSLTPSSDCVPFAVAEDGRPIAPCGAIANSLFNGKIQQQQQQEQHFANLHILLTISQTH